MLEGENHVDGCKQKLTVAESREAKLRKDYKKALKRAEHQHAGTELHDIEAQLKQATHARDLAQEECRIPKLKSSKNVVIKTNIISIFSDGKLQRKRSC